LQVAHHAQVDAVVQWLASQAAVAHIEHRPEQQPHAAVGRRIIFEGDSQEALAIQNAPHLFFERR
jgi:hypothetical protein